MRTDMQAVQDLPPALPSSKEIRAHVLAALGRYWPNDAQPVNDLPTTELTLAEAITGPLQLIEVKLPKWAEDCGVDGCLLVPQEAVVPQPRSTDVWQQADWWLAAFLLLEAWHERVWEHECGPIHSYSVHLKGWDERVWQRAWVNRIALFLRRWAIYHSGIDVEARIGPLPNTKIQMTHDVDAVAKTLPIRFKQGAFNLFNAFRFLRSKQYSEAGSRLIKMGRFLIGREDWWTFDHLLKVEADANIIAIFNFHVDPRQKSLKRWLFDPGYNILKSRQKELLTKIIHDGHRIGLHPGFDTWRRSERIAEQRHYLEEATKGKVTDCRQHWLRFSWRDTWAAQQAAGIQHDTTMMFNDRSGFRNSSALIWQPWGTKRSEVMKLTSQATVFMDSHFYDYQPIPPAERYALMQYWLKEVYEVSGSAAILWHPHTLSNDYGWSEGFEDAVRTTKEFSI